jgi:hypothetical protein
MVPISAANRTAVGFGPGPDEAMEPGVCLEGENQAAERRRHGDHRQRPDSDFLELLEEIFLLEGLAKQADDGPGEQQPDLADLRENIR